MHKLLPWPCKLFPNVHEWRSRHRSLGSATWEWGVAFFPFYPSSISYQLYYGGMTFYFCFFVAVAVAVTTAMTVILLADVLLRYSRNPAVAEGRLCGRHELQRRWDGCRHWPGQARCCQQCYRKGTGGVMWLTPGDTKHWRNISLLMYHISQTAHPNPPNWVLLFFFISTKMTS